MQGEIKKVVHRGRRHEMITVDVPHKEQTIPNTCGPNTIAMLAQYFLCETVDRRDVAGYHETATGHELLKTGIRNFCQTFEAMVPGWKMEMRSLQPGELVPFLRDQLSAGIPVPFSYVLKTKHGKTVGLHYSIVTGLHTHERPRYVEITDGRFPLHTARVLTLEDLNTRMFFGRKVLDAFQAHDISAWFVGLFYDNVVFEITPEHSLDGVAKVPVPAAAAENADEGLRLANLHKRGGTQTGHQRAKQLMRESHISTEDTDQIWRWFQRHSHFQKHHRAGQNPSNSYISWLLWGGDIMWKTVAASRRKRGLDGLSGLGLPLDGSPTESGLRKKARQSGIPYRILMDVYRRGVGAYKTNFSAVRPWVKKLPRAQGMAVWASGRVNKFIQLLKEGGPQNVYKPDRDLAYKAVSQTGSK